MRKVQTGTVISNNIEVRKADDGSIGLRGYAAVYDQVENGEVLRPGTFARSIAHGGDVKLLLGHEGLPLASTRAGTMTVGEDDHGFWVDVEGLDVANPRAAELASILARGDVSDMSIGFVPVRESRMKDGTREIVEARVLECSIVTWGWYPGTEVSLKSLTPLMAQLRSSKVPACVRESVRDALEGRAIVDGSFDAIREAVRDAICGRIEELAGIEPWLWICDIGPDWAVYELDDDCFRVDYAIDADGVVTLGDPVEVERVTQWVPAVEPVVEQMAAVHPRLELAKALSA